MRQSLASLRKRIVDVFRGYPPCSMRCYSRCLLAVVAIGVDSIGTRSSIAGMQDALRIGDVRSRAEEGAAANPSRLVLYRARTPVFVDVDLGSGVDTPSISKTVLADVLGAIEENPRRLVTLRFSGGALRFGKLTLRTREALIQARGESVAGAYNLHMAAMVENLLDTIEEARPGLPIAIQGLPFEGSFRETDSANIAYERVVGRLDGFVVAGGIVSGSADIVGLLWRAFPTTLRTAEARPIIFAVNDRWQIAMSVNEEASDPLVSEETIEIEVASDSNPGLEARPVLASPVNDSAGDTLADAVEAADDSASEPGQPGAEGLSSGGGNAAGQTGSVGALGSNIGVGGGSEGEEVAASTEESPDGSEQQGGDEVEGSDEQGADSEGGSIPVDEGETNGQGEGGQQEEGENSADDEPADGDFGDDWEPGDEIQEDPDDNESENSDDSDNENDPSGGDEGNEEPDSDEESSDGNEADEDDEPGDQGGGGDPPGQDSSDDEPGAGEDPADDDAGSDQGPGELLLRGSGDGEGSLVPEDTTCDGDVLGNRRTPIVRWNAVPYRAVTEPTGIGLLAFHASGIKRVIFAADGGPPVAVDVPSRNPRTGTTEYWVTLDPEGIEGNIVVEALIEPECGVSRVVTINFYAPDTSSLSARPSLHVSEWGSDSVGTGDAASPLRTLAEANRRLRESGEDKSAEVILHPGQYNYDGASGDFLQTASWITIRSLNGDPSEVVLTSDDVGSNSGFRAAKVNLRDVTITGQIYTNSAPDDYLWIEGCELRGGGPGGVSHWKEGWWTGVYVINSRSYDSIMGFPFAALARDCVADTIYIDAFPGGQAIVNCTVRNHIGGQHPETGYVYHPDIWQERTPATDFDVVIYGLAAVENNIRQAFFTRNFTGHENVAIVNSSVYLGGYPYRSFIGSRFEHFLVLNNSILGSSLELGLSDNHPQVPGFGGSEDVVFDGNIFQWVPVSDEAGEHPFWSESDWSSLGEGRIYFGRNHFVNRWPHAPEQSPWNATMLGESPSEGPDIPGDLGPTPE